MTTPVDIDVRPRGAAGTTAEHRDRDGEVLTVLERVIVAPCVGVFEALPPKTVTTEGEIIVAGQAVGVLQSSGSPVVVASPFAGFLMGFLAVPGERVREGQPIAWLRVFDA